MGARFPAATLLLSGSFGFTEYTNLLFYDGESGTGSFMGCNYSDATPDVASWSVCELRPDWGKGLDAIVVGNFWMADPDDIYFADGAFADLLFYDKQTGTGQFYMHEPLDPTPSMPLAGYASARSVFPGDTINFYISSQVGDYKFQILRKGLQEVRMMDLDVTPADPLPIPRQAYRDGAGWPPVATLTIPEDWPSGLYFARAYIPPLPTSVFGGPNVNQRLTRLQYPTLDIPFVLRPANPGQSARILLVIPDTVYEAYNFWGGRSLYGFASQESIIWAYPQTATHVPYSFRVSFLRPHWGPPAQDVKWQHYEVPFIQWIERQAIRVEYCVASDLDSQSASSFLPCYKLVVIVGHSEYRSKGMKDNVQAFISKGGNAAFFGGNICYWQVRFENDSEHGPTMVCYKQEPFDPNSSGSPQQRQTRTVLWRMMNSPADGYDTDYKLTGVSYEWTTYPSPTAFKVVDPGHWVFANTGLAMSEPFGEAVAGPETDHRTIPSSDELGPGDTPANFVLVANEMIDGGKIASMGVMEGAGTVFTSAATE